MGLQIICTKIIIVTIFIQDKCKHLILTEKNVCRKQKHNRNINKKFPKLMKYMHIIFRT